MMMITPDSRVRKGGKGELLPFKDEWLIEH